MLFRSCCDMDTNLAKTVPAQASVALYLFLLCFASEAAYGKAQNFRTTPAPAPAPPGLGKEEQRAINELLTVLGLMTIPIFVGLLLGAWRYRRSLYKILPEIQLRKVTARERRLFMKAEQEKARAEELRAAADPPAEDPILMPAEPKKDLGPLNDVEAFFRSDAAEDDDRSVFAQSSKGSKASASTESLGGRNEGLDDSFGSRRGGSKASSGVSKAALIASYARSRPQSEISEGSLDHAAIHPEGPALGEGGPPLSSLGSAGSAAKDFLRLPDEHGRVARKGRKGSKQSNASRQEGKSSRSGSKGSSASRSGSKETSAEGEIKRNRRRLLTN